MKSKNKIILFMKAKQSILEDNYPHITNLYFNKKDIDMIRKWSSLKSWLVWLRIKFAIFIQHKYGLSRDTCAFCIACLYSCKNCEFAITHKRCGSESGDFHRINKRINDKEAKRILSNKAYRDIVRRIEMGIDI